MPRYRVSGPGGVTYLVNAPEGMTDEQILAYAQQPHNFTGPATAEDKNAVQSLPLGQYLPVNPLTIAAGSALVGAGRTGSKIEAGNQQIALNALGTAKQAMGMDAGQQGQDLQDLAQMQRDNDAAYAPLRQQHPFFTGAGESGPAIGIPVGQATAFGRILAPALGLGGIEAAQYGTPQQRAMNGAKGFVLGGTGGALGEMLNTAIAPASSSLSSAQQAAVTNAADRLGVNLRPSQVTGNPTLARVEDTLSRLPLSSNVFANLAASNQRQINKAAASSMGDNADALTKDVLASNKQRLGQQLDGLRSQTQMPVTSPVLDSISQAEGLLNRGVKNAAGKAEALQTFADLKDRLYGSKQLSGDEYQAIVSDLKAAARGTQNQTVAAAYKQIVAAMDKEAQGTNAPLWAQANKEYGSFKTLVRPGVVNEVTGDVQPGALSRAMDQQFRESNKTGKIDGPLADIADYYKALPPMRAGSPTFERGAATNPLQWMASPAYWLAAQGMTSPAMRAYLGKGLLGASERSDIAGKVASRALLPLGAAEAQQALLNLGLLGYAQ